MVYIDVKESWTQILDIDCGKGINRFKLGLKKKKKKSRIQTSRCRRSDWVGLVLECQTIITQTTNLENCTTK